MEQLVLHHSLYRLENERWVANVELEFHEGAGVAVQHCLEPNVNLTFATREEAIERDRQLALAWRDRNASGRELRARDPAKK